MVKDKLTRHKRPKEHIPHQDELTNDKVWHYIEVSGDPDKIKEFKQFIHHSPHDSLNPLQWIVLSKPPANSIIYLAKSDNTVAVMDRPDLLCSTVLTTKHSLIESGNLTKCAEAFPCLRISGLIKSKNEFLSFLSATGIKRLFRRTYPIASTNPGHPNYDELKSLLDSFSCEVI